MPMEKVRTPGVKTIEDLAKFMGDSAPPPERSVKTMIVQGSAGAAAVLLQGGHMLNLIKAAAQPEIGSNAELLSEDKAKKIIGAGFGSLGPVGMPLPVIADIGLSAAADFVCGANEDDMHCTGVNFGRDCPEPRFADVRFAAAGDPSPDGRGILRECRGVEVGHIFQLGDKYSKAMGGAGRIAGGGRSSFDDGLLRHRRHPHCRRRD